MNRTSFVRTGGITMISFWLFERRPRVLALLIAVVGCTVSCSKTVPTAKSIRGAGATFPAPLYERWFQHYQQLHPDVSLSYQKVGSGEGIKQFSAGQVEFGASDQAMSDEQMASVPSGVQLMPITAGIIALGYNPKQLPKNLKLSRSAYAGICLGTITVWNDPEIIRFNEGVTLPAQPIKFVHRVEASGTTFVFTQHLSAVNNAWKERLGVGSEISWPVGLAAKGNDGVAALINETPGGIGYLDFGVARQANLPMAALENNAGSFVAPTVENGQEALVGFKLPTNLRGWVTDPPGKTAYPIVTFSWLLCRKRYDDPVVAATMRELIRYCLTTGQKSSGELGYIPLPDTVASVCMNSLDNITP